MESAPAERPWDRTPTPDSSSISRQVVSSVFASESEAPKHGAKTGEPISGTLPPASLPLSEHIWCCRLACCPRSPRERASPRPRGVGGGEGGAGEGPMWQGTLTCSGLREGEGRARHFPQFPPSGSSTLRGFMPYLRVSRMASCLFTTKDKLKPDMAPAPESHLRAST